jgi:hypothetical protein
LTDRRSGRGFTDLAIVLADLAHRSGEDRLELASVSAAMAAALGPYLARRVLRVHVEDGRCELEMSDAHAAHEVERHRRAVLDDVRRRVGGLAPRVLAVTSRRAAPQRPPASPPRGPSPSEEPGPLAREALEAIPDDAERAQLERWTSRARRRSR